MTSFAREAKRATLDIAGARIEIHEYGDGDPILFLHGGHGFLHDDAFLSALAKHRRIVAPSHPGFGGSDLPDWLDSVEDIAHIHLELMDKLHMEKVHAVGCSLGAWIAAEMATKAPERFRRLALVAPIGVKIGPSDKLDIPDIFAMPPAELDRLSFHDPARFKPDFAQASVETIENFARARETLTLLAWEPYMHNPKLKHRLQRLHMPTLFVRGESDGLVTQPYFEGYAKLVPGARVETIAQAGHSPQLEQPERLAASILAFLHT